VLGEIGEGMGWGEVRVLGDWHWDGGVGVCCRTVLGIEGEVLRSGWTAIASKP